MAEAGEANRLEELRKQVAKSRALKAQGVKFELDSDGGEKTVKAVRDGRILGQMILKKPSTLTNFKGAREVKMVNIEPDARRQGLATSLFNEAKKLGLNPIHSNKLSTEGKLFSTAQGGQRIPDPELTRQELSSRKFDKESSKQYGQRRAKDIAKRRAEVAAQRSAMPTTRSGMPQPDINALRTNEQLLRRNSGPSFMRPGSGWGATANMGLGALNILGFLPTLMQGGQAAQGRLNLMPNDPTIGQIR